jgi:hypothetical protein
MPRLAHTKVNPYLLCIVRSTVISSKSFFDAGEKKAPAATREPPSLGCVQVVPNYNGQPTPLWQERKVPFYELPFRKFISRLPMGVWNLILFDACPIGHGVDEDGSMEVLVL